MRQPDCFWQFYDSLAKIGNKNNPIVGTSDYLLPFQLTRLDSASLISTFEFKNDCTTIDLSSDIGRLVLVGYTKMDEFFDETVYNSILYYGYPGLAQITTSIANGVYYCHISDGTNDWYSDWIKIKGEYNDIVPYLGAFNEGFSSGFDIGTI